VKQADVIESDVSTTVLSVNQSTDTLCG